MLISAVAALAGQPPLSRGVHRALGGILEHTAVVLDGLDWSSVEPPVRARWQRDQPLLAIAGRVRRARLSSARQSSVSAGGECQP